MNSLELSLLIAVLIDSLICSFSIRPRNTYDWDSDVIGPPSINLVHGQSSNQDKDPFMSETSEEILQDIYDIKQ